MTNLEIMNIGVEIAREAGTLLQELQGDVTITNKSLSYDLVTEADVKTQALIEKRLKREFPSFSFMGEEGESKGHWNNEAVWIVDPLDGTNNYAHHFPRYSVSMACLKKGKTVAGIVYDPSMNEIFTAAAGEGSWCNEKKINASEAKGLNESLILVGFYYDRGAMIRRTLDSIEKLFDAGIHGIRRMGSAAIDLCWVAAGRCEAYFEEKLSIWDYAAGALIAQEAGAIVSDIHGNPYSHGMRGMICSAPGIYEEFRSTVHVDESIPEQDK